MCRRLFIELEGRTLVERAVDRPARVGRRRPRRGGGSGRPHRSGQADPGQRCDRRRRRAPIAATRSAWRWRPSMTAEQPDFVLVHDAARRADTARSGGAGGRGAAGRASGRRARRCRVSDTIKAVDANGAVLGTPGTGRTAGRADAAGLRDRPAAAGLPASRNGRTSPTTRRWSSTSAVRFRWSTAIRWPSRSPPGWT